MDSVVMGKTWKSQQLPEFSLLGACRQQHAQPAGFFQKVKKMERPRKLGFKISYTKNNGGKAKE